MRIALDAMGGDFAPREAVLGGLQAAEATPDHEVVLVGDRAAIESEIEKSGLTAPRNIAIVHASQTIAMDEKPVAAIKKKPDSSVLRGMGMVAAGEAQAIVSAGNTGAMVAAAMLGLKPLPGVRRAGIAVSAPTETGCGTVLDVGANLNCKPIHLFQYGIMGSVLHSALYDCESPRVGLLNVGEEESKGSPLLQEAGQLLAKAPIHFVGNAEGRDVFENILDVVVCDGFTGNAIVKAIEGYGEMLSRILRTAINRDVWGRLSFNLMRPVLLKLQHKTDFADYGGGPLLGVSGGVIICHGRSNARAIHHAIARAITFIRADVNGTISRLLEET